MESIIDFFQAFDLREVIAAGVGVFVGLLLARALNKSGRRS